MKQIMPTNYIESRYAQSENNFVKAMIQQKKKKKNLYYINYVTNNGLRNYKKGI